MFCPYADAQRPHRSQRATPDPALAAGMPLPSDLRRTFPRDLIGKPIDELDPFYANKTTFVVVGHHWIVHRFDGDKSLFLMSPSSRVRSASIHTVTHAAFHYFMFIVILTNVLCFLHHKYFVFHEIFFLVYFVELLVKVIAYGLLAKRFTYLRDPWNWVDFLATLTGFMTVYIGVSSNPIRFLRLVNFFTRPRLIFATSCSLLLRMRDVLCFAAFSIFFYSVYFMHCFTGVLSQRCVKDLAGLPTDLDTFNFSNGYASEDHELCGYASGAIHCPENYTCHVVPNSNPNYGYTNFDTFFSSAMSVLRLMTRDWWEGLLTQVESTMGAQGVPSFLVVLVFGSFVLSNFIMAHMAIAHGQLMDVLRERKYSPPLQSGEDKKTEDGERLESSRDVEDSNEEGRDKEAPESWAHFDKRDSSPRKEPELVIVMDKRGHERGRDDFDANPFSVCCSSCCELLCSWKCCSWLQAKLSVVVNNRYFDRFICATIVTNTVFLALDHHRMPIGLADIIQLVNVAVLFVFVVEAVLKILAMSPNRYFRDSWCVFEFFVVVVSILELLFVHVAGLSVLRACRIFRMVRLAKFNNHLNRLLRPSHVNVYLLAVFVVSFGLLGFSTFGFHYWLRRDLFPDKRIPRLNFMDFWNSLVIVFRVLCGQWSEAYWDCSLVSGSACLPYFLAVVILGNLLVINVFISMITTSFLSNDLCDTELDDAVYVDFSIARAFRSLRSCPKKQKAEKIPAAKSEEQLFEVSLEVDANTGRGPPELNINEEGGGMVAEPCCPTTCWQTMDVGSSTPASSSPNAFWKKWQTIRNSTLALLGHKTFHTWASVFILFTSIVQVLDDRHPYSSSIETADVSRVVSIVVCAVFSLELILKFVGIGFHKYFSNGWNCFDFAVTILHVLGYLLSGFDTPGRSLAFLEALRILKLFSYHKRLRVVIEAVLFRFGHVASALLASLLVWLIFAIIGVQMFAGHFHECIDDHSEPVSVNIVDDRDACYFNNFTWVNTKVNFDHVPNALFALLQVATMRGDLTILFNLMDTQGEDRQPIPGANAFSASYFMVFMPFGVLCCLACVFRAFITKANSQKRLFGGYLETLMTPTQRLSYGELKKAFFKKPLKTVPEPDAAVLLPLYRMVTSRSFHLVVFLVLVFNAAAMALHYPFIGSRMYNALGYVQLAFNSFFFIEIVLKMIAFRLHFFDSPWNIFDFVVIVPLPFSVMAVEMAYNYGIYFASPLQFRLLIVLRLVRRIKCVRRVLHGIWVSRAAYKNVAFVLAVVVFYYTRLGIGWFGGEREHRHGGIDELHNFDDFGPAVSTVTQMAIGGGLWEGIHRGLSAQFDSIRVTLFVLSLLFVCFVVVVHFFAVLLLEHYERIWRKKRLRIADDDLEDFAATWRVFDPYGSGTMSYEDFADFLAALPPTYKMEAPVSDEKIASLGVKMTVQEQRLTFDDVLVALLRALDHDRVVFRAQDVQ